VHADESTNLSQTIDTLNTKIESLVKKRKILHQTIADKDRQIQSMNDVDNRNENMDKMYDMLGELDKLLVDTETEKNK
jgi:hypothetical protein